MKQLVSLGSPCLLPTIAIKNTLSICRRIYIARPLNRNMTIPFLSRRRRRWVQIPTIISQNTSSKRMKYRADTIAATINGPVAKGAAIYHAKYVKPSCATYCVRAPFIRNDRDEKFRNVNPDRLLSFTASWPYMPAIPKFHPRAILSPWNRAIDCAANRINADSTLLSRNKCIPEIRERRDPEIII